MVNTQIIFIAVHFDKKKFPHGKKKIHTGKLNSNHILFKLSHFHDFIPLIVFFSLKFHKSTIRKSEN
jgi:hypothetical protein